MRQSPWACTIFIQLSLCVAIYVSLHLGRSLLFSDADNGRHLDLHFITVSGGSRPLHQQNRLLKLMGSVARSYNARVVVSISDIGDKDPLFRNATRVSSSLKLPWYITGDSRENESGYFTKRIKLPIGGALDIVFIATGSSQQHGPTNTVSDGSGSSRVNELTRALKAANADWRIVVGSDPLFVDMQGKEPKEVEQVDETFHQLLIDNGVNVYLSDKGCINGTNQTGIACIVVPTPTENRRSSSSTKRKKEDGFLLHRLSFSDLLTSFIGSSGVVVDTRSVKQKGKEAM
ncbi:PREDICTED: uncharacterized protein LOC104803568 [Tarenaya hassleriana]|uniref:uncharacterized protein LOC104803568 n=1 Tax=Tarenaya hassleriana TaxID=28532 RepID=UPI00053C3F98|nr:PREDICTED: uncharacterized protein LOC104803568 [Tarenaya hassleriana]